MVKQLKEVPSTPEAMKDGEEPFKNDSEKRLSFRSLRRLPHD